ncbi:MAG TPA: hypothetical protein VJV78_03940 [Polyangiales bacterium]|nr:hypothetical protein [Polyangiales bacterium]
MKRMTDDPAMPAELRADLLRSRRAGRDYDALAKLPQLRSALSDASRQPPELEPSSAWPRLDSVPWAWKLAVIVAAIGGGATFAAWPREREQPAIVQQEPTPAPVAVVPPQQVEAPAPPRPEPPTESVSPRAAAAAPSSRREIDQLQRIRATLERDPAAAYRLAQRSEQEFPNGLLHEERRALQILALAKTGATDAAERRARQFFARYPQSPMRERVEAALAH